MDLPRCGLEVRGSCAPLRSRAFCGFCNSGLYHLTMHTADWLDVLTQRILILRAFDVGKEATL